MERWEGKLVEDHGVVGHEAFPPGAWQAQQPVAGIVAEVPVLPVATLGIILKQNSSATLAVAG